MKLVLDSNRYTDFWNGVAQVVEVLEAAEMVYMPFAVLGELRSGFLNGSNSAQNERTLRTFLNKSDVEVLLGDDATTVHYAAIHHQLRIGGTPIPINDVWIAALAVQHALPLYTRDKHFDHIPQLMRI